MDSIDLVTYPELEEYAKYWINGDITPLMVLSKPGRGKSQMFTKLVRLEGGYVVSGRVTEQGMYEKLYEYREKPILFDDVRKLLTDPGLNGLLKIATSTDVVRKVGWFTNDKAARFMKAPNEFEMTSPICVLANRATANNEDVDALLDRFHVAWFNPSHLTMHENATNWAHPDVASLIAETLDNAPELSLRHYAKGGAMSLVDPRWQERLLEMMKIDPAMVALKRLLADPSYATNADRAKEFKERGFGSLSTFNRRLKELGKGTGEVATKLKWLPKPTWKPVVQRPVDSVQLAPQTTEESVTDPVPNDVVPQESTEETSADPTPADVTPQEPQVSSEVQTESAAGDNVPSLADFLEPEDKMVLGLPEREEPTTADSPPQSDASNVFSNSTPA